MNQPMTDQGRKLVREFERHVKFRVSEHGIWPLPMHVLTGRGVDVTMMRLTDAKALEVFARATRHVEVLAAIVGLDRYDDGFDDDGFYHPHTELKDLLSITLYEVDSTDRVRLRDQYKFGIIEYCHSPRVVRPVDWDNQFWQNQMESELWRFVPDVIRAGDVVLMGPDMHLVDVS